MRTKILSAIALLIGSISSGLASTISGTYPWDSTLDKITKDLSTNIAIGIAIICIIVGGCTMAFIDLQSGGKRLLQAFLGLSVVFGAVSVITKLYSSGAII